MSHDDVDDTKRYQQSILRRWCRLRSSEADRRRFRSPASTCSSLRTNTAQQKKLSLSLSLSFSSSFSSLSLPLALLHSLFLYSLSFSFSVSFSLTVYRSSIAHQAGPRSYLFLQTPTPHLDSIHRSSSSSRYDHPDTWTQQQSSNQERETYH